MATLVAAIAAYFFHPDRNSTVEIVNWVTTKLVVLALLIAATLWCSRLYKSEKHQEALATHRQHARSTFETFIAASRDDATKAAVLLAMTQSIFALASPGYLGGLEGGLQHGPAAQRDRQHPPISRMNCSTLPGPT